MNNGAVLTMWSWSRLNAGGHVLVCGSGHASLEACFASVRLHSAQFGEVPVKINLGQPAKTSSPLAPHIPVARRDGMVANIDRAPAQRRKLPACVPAPAAIATLSASRLSYVS